MPAIMSKTCTGATFGLSANCRISGPDVSAASVASCAFRACLSAPAVALNMASA